MTKEEIMAKVTTLIVDHFEVDANTVTPEMNFKRDLDADSIDFVEFVLELEDTFGGEIPDEDAEGLQTVGQAVDYIFTNMAK
ncbi:hypothetical protein FC62_GL000057 [Amylolactobacillus amylotrophicus DSM 20534]|uniref:Acyl carrier protein n=3 Tax=Amylolactobacillus TaxID=2767876 RepID=A0A0R1YKV5_9LACO|nr:MULTISPECIES: acyl carrier protein [Amylolactobacillus]APT17916.1 acyl carrier protein [Amylolactobacillus amylophilus DSM 20533 = JCM 1125]KRK38374.1 hypothetical protein FC62_GL000057 [Amylolactobacillus amylotrophicus DSM 20534]KRM42983.1 hypothetical protein FD40_GL000782 [Amylolactobacillus amylophilus DSM 20533 = JCM 1125]GED79852.1 acyl carrier protein [Amylolactobacillus amylophilus]